MSHRIQHLLAVLALVGLVAATACQQRQEVEDGDDVDTLSTSTDVMPAPPAGMPEDTMGMGTDMGGGSEVSVTNSMPHAMIVRADAGQGPMELGTVAPNETRSFSVSAAPGSQVTLTASDSAATHSTSGSVSVGGAAPATWTIQ